MKSEQNQIPGVLSKNHVMRFNLFFVLLLATFYSFSQDTIAGKDLFEFDLKKGYCGPFQTFRKNGTLKSEFYDNYIGHRIYYYYSNNGRRKRMKFLFDVKWARNYIPVCFLISKGKGYHHFHSFVQNRSSFSVSSVSFLSSHDILQQ